MSIIEPITSRNFIKKMNPIKISAKTTKKMIVIGVARSKNILGS